MSQINCHYVTRFLTTPWELEGRRLEYYDFELGQFGNRRSRYLFAIDGLNSKDEEERLNQLVETPLAIFRDMLVGFSPEEVNVVEDWKVLRALYLLIPFQVARTQDVQQGANVELRRLLDKDDRYLDQLATAASDNLVTCTISLPDQQRLYYPENGFFAFSAPDLMVKSNFGFAVPLGPTVALIAIPKSTDRDRLAALCGSNCLLLSASVGPTSGGRRVVVHPDLLDGHAKSEIEETLNFHRTLCTKHLSLTARFHDDFRKIDSIAGYPMYAPYLSSFIRPALAQKR